jgi:predicted ATPase
MIDHLLLRNFKRFTSLSLNLAPLTVLTGVNSAGKSSVLQALLLLHIPKLHPGGAIPLSGPHGLALGEASDVLCAQATDAHIEISFSASGVPGRLLLEVPGDRSAVLTVSEEDLPKDLPSLSGAQRSFIYLCAERLGPRDLQEVAADAQAELSVGVHGEYTAHVLSQLSRWQIEESRRHPETDANGGIITLGAQAELWMSTIVCPLRIEANWLVGTNAAMLRFKRNDVLTDWLRPANVGFGVSYALPIVVAGLTAAPSGLLIVENPEAHLHPAGQSAMGRFLASVAAAGVQVILETHSDHLLNGIRIAVGADGSLTPEAVSVHYFEDSGDVRTLTMDSHGAVSEWPLGFFDQMEHDLGKLAKARQREGVGQGETA